MKIFEINECLCGSTGNIAISIGETVIQEGGQYKLSVANSRTNQAVYNQNAVYIGNRLTRNINLVFSYITGFNSVLSFTATRTLLKKISEFSPDIVHLHNLHNSYINIPMLFNYIKKKNITVVWTLHDCWAFTGQCPHFTIIKCNKWKTGCYNCAQYRTYPSACVDQTKQMWKLKKKWFTGVENMTIVTPSQWLANLVNQSYLKNYPVKVINNGIDLSLFKPTPSDFRKKYQIENKYIILGVAMPWSFRKGMDVFINLEKRLDRSKYQIVLVGTSDEDDKSLPDSIISIHITNNKQELAEIYSAADLFVNPTREENYPTVNMEALACGTPVVTFETGGSPEILDDTCGVIAPVDDLDVFEKVIRYNCENKPFSKEDCLKRAEKFDMIERFREYVSLYQKLNKNK